MARNMYQYETSPRKIEPEYIPTRKKQVKKANENVRNKRAKTNVKTNNKDIINREQKIKNVKQISIVMIIFAVLLAISYRNSLINEQFADVKELKNTLATVKKENGQINKSIEESLNRENIEKIASEQLGMQKKTKEQTVEINIEKSDYIETATPEIESTKEETLIEKIINFFN